MDIGYKRFSPLSKKYARQLEEISLPDDALYVDNCTRKEDVHPALTRLLNEVNEGDTIYVQSFDRIATNLEELLLILEAFLNKKASIRFLTENITFTPDPNDSHSLMQMEALRNLYACEKKLRKERVDTYSASRRSGKPVGRPSTITEEQKAEVRRLLQENIAANISQISRETGVPKTTCFRIRAILKENMEKEGCALPDEKL
ncbi:MAG: recombinase family protein [Desulfovibrio sp.]|nr:recombinase family protein [Desulfovibrio sp.]